MASSTEAWMLNLRTPNNETLQLPSFGSTATGHHQAHPPPPPPAFEIQPQWMMPSQQQGPPSSCQQHQLAPHDSLRASAVMSSDSSFESTNGFATTGESCRSTCDGLYERIESLALMSQQQDFSGVGAPNIFSNSTPPMMNPLHGLVTPPHHSVVVPTVYNVLYFQPDDLLKTGGSSSGLADMMTERMRIESTKLVEFEVICDILTAMQRVELASFDVIILPKYLPEERTSGLQQIEVIRAIGQPCPCLLLPNDAPVKGMHMPSGESSRTGISPSTSLPADNDPSPNWVVELPSNEQGRLFSHLNHILDAWDHWLSAQQQDPHQSPSPSTTVATRTEPDLQERSQYHYAQLQQLQPQLALFGDTGSTMAVSTVAVQQGNLPRESLPCPF